MPKTIEGLPCVFFGGIKPGEHCFGYVIRLCAFGLFCQLSQLVRNPRHWNYLPLAAGRVTLVALCIWAGWHNFCSIHGYGGQERRTWPEKWKILKSLLEHLFHCLARPVLLLRWGGTIFGSPGCHWNRVLSKVPLIIWRFLKFQHQLFSYYLPSHTVYYFLCSFLALFYWDVV